MKYLFLLIILFACTNKGIKEFPLYTNTIIDKANPFPKSEELKGLPKVVIVVDDQTNLNIPNFNQKQIAIAKLEQVLTNLKTVKILDRGIVKSIKEELLLSQLQQENKNTEESINKDANYVLLLKLNSLIFSKNYDNRTFAKVAYVVADLGLATAGAVATNGKSINVRINDQNPISGEFDYTAAFDATLSVIKLPEAEVVSKIQIKNTAESSESGDLQGVVKGKETDPDLMKNAIHLGLDSVNFQIAKQLPAIGYIISRSDYKEDYPALFKISFGAKKNVKIGDTVVINQVTKETNPLTNEDFITIKKINLGQVIENGYDDYFCWVKVEDKALAYIVKTGDKVEVVIANED